MVLCQSKQFLLISIIYSICGILVKSDEELCRNPAVNSIDRFNNNTIRLFRDNYYWDLIEFNGEKAKIGGKGSMKEHLFFNPVDNTSRIVTVLSGSQTLKDRTFKFKGTFWWSWYVDPKFGVRNVGTEVGLYWDQIPKAHGFDAVFHNADKADPMLIGLESDPKFSDKNMKIHYFSTGKDIFVRKTSNFYDQNDFPKDMTDAFAMRPTDGLKYMVFILKAGEYCILTDKQKCSQWKSLSQLIGCSPDSVPKPGKGDSGEQVNSSAEVGSVASDGPSANTLTMADAIVPSDQNQIKEQPEGPSEGPSDGQPDAEPVEPKTETKTDIEPMLSSLRPAVEDTRSSAPQRQKIGLSLIVLSFIRYIY